MNSGLVALKTAKKLTFENTKKCYRQRTANMEQTGRETRQTNRQTENSKTEATLSPVVCGSSGNAGQKQRVKENYSFTL